jgi:phage gp37-like protein
MLDLLEKAIITRLEVLRTPLPRLELRSYGGELGDGDLLAEVLRAGHAVLVTLPRGKFTRKSNRRFSFTGTVRLVIGSRQARGELETRHGSGAGSPGTYALWDSCVRLLTGWCPTEESGALEPTEYNNLVNGKYQNDHLSVIGQSFSVDAHWSIPVDPVAPVTGIELTYYLQLDDDVADATDRIELETP